MSEVSSNPFYSPRIPLKFLPRFFEGDYRHIDRGEDSVGIIHRLFRGSIGEALPPRNAPVIPTIAVRYFWTAVCQVGRPGVAGGECLYFLPLFTQALPGDGW